MLTPLKQPATQSVLLQSIISGGRVTRRDSVPAMLTSQALDWPGVLLEAGTNDVATVDDVVGDRHFLSLNVDTKPLTLEVKGATGFRAFTVPPLSVWVSPGHDPLTLRLNSALRYLRVAIDTLHFGRLMGPSPDEAQPLRLRRTYGVASPQIVQLMLTLKDEADNANPGGLAVAGALCARLQGDDWPGAPPVSPGDASRARAAAARAVRCRPVGHRTAHRLRRPGPLHSPLQAGVPRHPGRPGASVAVLTPLESTATERPSLAGDRVGEGLAGRDRGLRRLGAGGLGAVYLPEPVPPRRLTA